MMVANEHYFLLLCNYRYNFMKVKCDHCSGMNDITYDSLIFENEDEEMFATYLSLEMSQEKGQ